MTFIFLTPHEVILQVATRAKEKRLALNLTQQSLSNRSGVSLGVLKKFERTGKVAFASLLKIAFTLDSLGEFDALFQAKPPESYSTLNALLNQKTRKRGGQ